MTNYIELSERCASLLDIPGFVRMSEPERRANGLPATPDEMREFIDGRREADKLLADPALIDLMKEEGGQEIGVAEGEWSDLCSRVAKLLEPAIDLRAPYSGVMIGAIVDMFVSRLERERDARQTSETEQQQMRDLLTQHMGWIKQFALDDHEWQARNWKDNMVRIRSQLDRMTHDFRVQI